MNKNYKFKCDKCKCIAGLSPVVEPNVTEEAEKPSGVMKNQRVCCMLCHVLYRLNVAPMTAHFRTLAKTVPATMAKILRWQM